ncbi:MAG: LysM peptidoglycan-binding domain-containing protein [Gemmatimonadota bacterium]
MKIWFAIPLVAIAACAGNKPAPTPSPQKPTTVASLPSPGEGHRDSTMSASDSGVFPASGDSLLPPNEEAAELELAADSAADAEVLDQLENTVAAVPESVGSESGGTNAVEGVTWDIDVATFTNHDRVQYFLDFFQGPARERMTVWLQRMPRYESMIRKRLAEQGLPGDLVYLALIESGFSNSAVSRARATGMWQFMKGTAQMYGLRIDSWVDERRDPYIATYAAARHLKDLRDRFGSVYLAAAAYNAGGGKVSRSLSRLPEEADDSLNTDATFFRLYDTRHLRQETRDYVPKLIAAALIAKEPARYGFPIFDSLQPIVWDSIIVPDATGLDVIARLADTTVTAIREINPQYLRLSTPPRSRSIIRLPVGKGPAVELAYAELPSNKRVTFQEHYVTRGQTLSAIARTYRVSVSDLKEANPGSSTRLRVGQRLIIPTGGVVVAREAARAEDRRAEIRRSVAATHTVRSGETLSEIGEHYHVSVTQLRSWNRLSGSNIRVGQKLRVGTTSLRSSRVTGGGSVHIVQPGDTLSGVAARYGVSQSALRAANGLSTSSLLRAGTRLRIP